MKTLSLLLLAGAASAATAAPGTLNLLGALTLKPGSILNFEIGGPTPSTGFDQLKVTGGVVLETDLALSPSGPAVAVTLINGYSPAAPAAFDLLDFASFTGTFSDTTLPTNAWSLSDFATTGEVRLNSIGGTGFSAFLGNNGLASSTSDEDFDGLNSVLEYAFGRLPRATTAPDGATALPLLGMNGGNAVDLTLDLPSPAPPDVIYTVEAQNGLTGTWAALATRTGNGPWAGTAAITPLAVAAGRETLRVTDPQLIAPGQPRRFLRLRTAIVAP